MTLLRTMSQLLRGRFRLWLCYTNVTWRTCERCLAWHGRIVDDPDRFPRHEGCQRELRPFPVWRLRAYSDEGRRMAGRARDELWRRSLFREAIALLPTEPKRSLILFDQAAAVDVYVPEVEALAREEALADPALRAQLREALLRRWKSKFAKERYERQPELARLEQERWGAQRIRELLP